MNEKALEVFNLIHSEDGGKKLIELMREIEPEFADIIVEDVARAYSRPGLDMKTRELITLSSLVTQGHAIPQVKAHVSAALKLGASKKEIIELMIQLVGCIGYPAVINGLNAAKEIFEMKGI